MNKKNNKTLIKIEKDKDNLLAYQLNSLKSNIKKARNMTNSGIRQFIENNKYIIIAISAVILAGLGYRVVNYISTVRQKTSKIGTSIDNIYQIIESDDRFLNESQQAIKYLYLYITEPSEFTKNKVKQLYDLHSNFLLDDLAQKSKVIINAKYDGGLDHSLNLLKKIDENTDQATINSVKNILNQTSSGLSLAKTGKDAITTTTQNVSNVISSTASTIGSLFGSFGYSKVNAKSSLVNFDNSDISKNCFNKVNSKYLKYNSINDFVDNYDLAEELFKNDFERCYIEVKKAMDTFKDDSKKNSCADIYIDLNGSNESIDASTKEFIKYYSSIYDDTKKISDFLKCYNE